MVTSLLVITAEPLGARMAGPAIRALELSRVLAKADPPVAVTLRSLASCTRQEDDLDLGVADTAELKRLSATVDAVLIQGDVLNLHPWLGALRIPMIVDVYDPFHLEQLEQAKPLGEQRRRIVVRDCVRALNRQLRRADFVLSATERQRDLWLGHLSALGRVNPLTYDADPGLQKLLAVVPFGVSDRQPEQLPFGPMRSVLDGVDDKSVIALWAGGLYDWFDPLLVLRAFAVAAARVPELVLVFLGAAHPVLGSPSLAEAALRSELAANPQLARRVHMIDQWVPYDERGSWLAEADIGVLAHKPGLETEFAFRTRLLDHLWARLPTLGTAGEVLIDRIAEAEAGITVPIGDVELLSDALIGLALDSDRRSEMAQAAAKLASRFSWAENAEPLLQFCRNPTRAPDLALSPGDRATLGLDDVRPNNTVIQRVRAALAEGGPHLVLKRIRHRLTRGR